MKKMKKIICVVLVVLLSFVTSLVSFAEDNQDMIPDVRNNSVGFKEVWSLPNHLNDGASYMADKFNAAIDKDTLELDSDKLLNIVRKDSTMTVTGTLNTSFSQTNVDVKEMSKKLVNFLAVNASAKLTDEQLADCEEKMKSIFLDLSSNNGAYYKWNDSTGGNASYDCYVLFVVEKNGRLLGLPVQFTVSVNASKTEYLNGIASNRKFNYSTKIKTLKVFKYR